MRMRPGSVYARAAFLQIPNPLDGGCNRNIGLYWTRCFGREQMMLDVGRLLFPDRGQALEENANAGKHRSEILQNM